MKISQTLLTVNCLLLLFTFNSSGQGVGINSTGASPDASALLDLNATNKGFLITRVDTTNIISPAFGLLTLAPKDSCLYLYNGIRWIGMGGGGSDCSCGSLIGGEQGTPSACGSPFTDARDGGTYGTVKIGKQCWMSENLAYLPSVVGPGTGNANTTTAYYYVYAYSGTDIAAAKNHPNYSAYGVLYNWTAAMAGSASSNSNPSGVQGICPDDWHLPSDEEWKELQMAIGMTQVEADKKGWGGTDEGSKLKTSIWGGNNSSGFTSLPGGYRFPTSGRFFNEGIYSSGWSSTESEVNKNNAWFRYLVNVESAVYRDTYNKAFGYSVRCVQD